MSLINQMLQDLDARRAAHGVGASLPNDVRPLPKAPASRLPLILGLVTVLLAGAFAFQQWAARNEAPAAAAPAVPVVVALPPALPAAPVGAPEKAVQAEPPPAEPEPPAASPLQELDGSLRMSEMIKPQEEKKLETRPVTAEKAAEKKPIDERNRAVAPERPPLPAVAAVPVEAVKPGRPAPIERSDAAGSPRDRAEGEYRKAIAAVNQGRLAEAMDGLRSALRQDVFHSASRQLLVRLLLEAKRPEEAMQVLQDGLQAQPAQLGWAMSLARLQVDRGDLAGAWQTLNYSQPAAGGNADYQGFTGHILQRLGRHREAAEHYQTASRLAPGDGRWWLGLGLTLEAEGSSVEAREAFLRARQSGSLNAELSALVDQKLR